MGDKLSSLIGAKVNLPNHFTRQVVVEVVKSLGDAVLIQVRTAEGKPDETVLTHEEIEELLSQVSGEEARDNPVSGEDLRLLIESLRIRLAYCYDPHFAVSLSGIQSLPHQIEAVYGKMLPQAMLRFLLADDPGAGKTIMTGLLIKELKLRRALDRVLIVVPAALTIQWQDELLRFFDEFFIIINADNDKQQLGNLWQRESQVITSLDYAKQSEVRERVWAASWDLVVLDEAHKCSAYTKRSSRRSHKTAQYNALQTYV